MTTQPQAVLDYGSINGKVRELGDGSLVVPARFSRAGTQIYGAPRFDVPTPVMRHAKDWLAPETIAQLAGITITIGHAAMIDDENVNSHSVGMVGTDVHIDGEWSAGDLIVQGKRAKSMALAGMDLSVGYYAEFRQECGVHDGITYEWAMYPIRMNHVALVERGRAGGARVMLDSVENGLHCLTQQCNATVAGGDLMTEPTTPEVSAAGQGWLEVVVDGESHKVRQGPADLIVRLAKERDVAIAACAAAQTVADEAAGKIAGLESDVQALKDAKPDLDAIRAEVKDAVSSRYALEADVKSLGLDVTDAMSDDDVRRAAVADMSPSAKIEHMNADNIGGLYAYLMAERKGATAADRALRGTLDSIATDRATQAAAQTPGDLALVSAVTGAHK